MKDFSSYLQTFTGSASVHEIWSSARVIMAEKMLPTVVEEAGFLSGLDRLGVLAKDNGDLERLLAIDLLVRLPAASAKLRDRAERVVRDALDTELPPLRLASNAHMLPENAKPSEIRENVASVLYLCRGAWVEDYIVQAVVEESQSRRTRKVLLRELVRRTGDLGLVLGRLSVGFATVFPSATNTNDRLTDLHQICDALVEIVSELGYDIRISIDAASNLDKFVRQFVRLSSTSKLPTKLDAVAASALQLLDGILSRTLKLSVEAEAYSLITQIRKWWGPLEYPDSVKTAMVPHVSKLENAISIRARMGQKSDQLAGLLRDALHSAEKAEKVRIRIADEENLDPEIDDWLRGHRRVSSIRSGALMRALQGTSREDADSLIASLLLVSIDAAAAIDSADVSAARNFNLQMINRIRSIASQRGLQSVGVVGEIVDFNPSAHETLDGERPGSYRVKLTTPMVVRTRAHGSKDVILKAKVTEVD